MPRNGCRESRAPRRICADLPRAQENGAPADGTTLASALVMKTKDRLEATVHGYLAIDCDRMSVCAEEALCCADAGEASAVQVHLDELASLALRHVRIGENLLAPGVARALRVDHRRLTQLVSEVQLTLDGADLRGVAKLLRRALRLLQAHEAHERRFVS
jgi:hypothetical protein